MTDTPVRPATPHQLMLECKAKGCDATLELRTHGSVKDGAHRWTQLSAAMLIKPQPQKRGRLFCALPPVRIAWAIADLNACRLVQWSSEDAVWIGSAAFDIDRKELQRVTEFLVTLGVDIEDNTKGDGK